MFKYFVLEFNLYFILILLTRWERQKVQSITGILNFFLIIDKTRIILRDTSHFEGAVVVVIV